ncbi:hypothetical protein [Fundidesulfovibrio soli]|uniref:hypothetical protein n=1 Tax=Fundidesulfovibrio soli TaxID=2922716 RepID=UPI001FAF2DDC|nr:hypothetical protein [Fundidesulfovibrio soli]
MSNPLQIGKLASYIAATYAFSTHTVPRVVDFKDLIQIAFQSTLEDTTDYERMIPAGLLVVTNPFGTFSGADKASGTISSLLLERMSGGKPTVFIDVLFGDTLSLADRGLHPTEKEYRQMVYNLMGGSKLTQFLAGGNTKVMFPSNLRSQASEEASGVHRKTVTV